MALQKRAWCKKYKRKHVLKSVSKEKNLLLKSIFFFGLHILDNLSFLFALYFIFPFFFSFFDLDMILNKKSKDKKREKKAEYLLEIKKLSEVFIMLFKKGPILAWKGPPLRSF